MASDEDFEKTQKRIGEAVVNTTRTATRIAAEDIAFHRSSNPTIGLQLDQRSARLLSLTEKLIRRATSSAKQLSLRTVDDVDSSLPKVIDVADSLLERVDTSLDEFTGLVKRAAVDEPGETRAPKARKFQASSALPENTTPKPQLQFDVAPANHETKPFRPYLTSKPHAIVPLEESLKLSQNSEGFEQYEHPYRTEIERYDYPRNVYQRQEPVHYHPFETTTAKLVEGFEDVRLMLAELKNAKEIAIDLEHHEVHSYIGLVSLMQISTRDQDWIVDTLKPWRRKLEILNEVFADPSIVKVFHGAYMDMIWLQRDLGIYVVGLFDTHHASRVLHYPGGSLAFLLKKFIDFDAQKQYQTADWRLRPLPSEMFDYARSDTHFLLYIYDCMRNELIDNSNSAVEDGDLVADVLVRSKNVALNRYEHPIYDDTYAGRRNGWFSLLAKHPSELSKNELAVFARVHRWRDEVARQEDEGIRYIMPSHVIFNIARAQPKDRAALLGACHPISQIVRMRSDELLHVVQRAIAEAPNFPGIPPALAYGAGLRLRPTAAIDVAQAESIKQPVPADVDNSNLRIYQSRFWGHTLSSTRSSRTAPLVPAFTVTFPGLRSTATSDSLKSNDAVSPDAPPTDEVTSSLHYDGLGKRKLASPNAESATTDTAIKADEAPFDKIQRRAARKAMKKSRKEGRLDAEGATNGDASSNGGSVAFDYESAPSVLNADPRAIAQSAQQKGARRAVVNPYSKGDAASAGLKRVQNMKVGKSTTFR
ncbi:MAG: exosome nuclease subunit [Chrysothrix sp. TS-e1954]|nr:MAG: exosome nuclease subunit [Chrysothrix sp. TS-e1954]